MQCHTKCYKNAVSHIKLLSCIHYWWCFYFISAGLPQSSIFCMILKCKSVVRIFSKISTFVFHESQSRVWNNMTVNKWQNFSFWGSYSLNTFLITFVSQESALTVVCCLWGMWSVHSVMKARRGPLCHTGTPNWHASYRVRFI